MPFVPLDPMLGPVSWVSSVTSNPIDVGPIEPRKKKRPDFPLNPG